jgi:hypothetical protein
MSTWCAELDVLAGPGWLSSVWRFLNGNFGLALISASAGSFAGAWGAQIIAEQQGAKRRALEELRATNAATSLALSTTNMLIALKNQHLQRMLKHYGDDRNRLLEIRSAGHGTFKFTADFEALPWIELPTRQLSETVLREVDAPAAMIALMTMVNGSAAHLKMAIGQRNKLIEEVKDGPSLAPKQMVDMYFGIESDGRCDKRYYSYINSINNYADSAILFSALITDQLIGHARNQAKRLGKAAPKVTDADFRPAFETGLIPDPNEYADTLRPIGIDPAIALARHRTAEPALQRTTRRWRLKLRWSRRASK